MRARRVISLRLSDSERATIEGAARRERKTISEFVRQAALLLAPRLSEPTTPKAEPAARVPPDGPHVTRTYNSFEEYAHRDGFPPGPDTVAVAAHYLASGKT